MFNNTKIIIVDDHVLFREGIKLLIEIEGMGKVIAEAENGQEFINLLKDHEPDIVLMDIEMPVMNGIEATVKALAIRPALKILALTMYGQKDNHINMINAGAMGFILKTSGKQDLEKAIKMVSGGESFFSNDLLRDIIVNFGKQPNNKVNPQHVNLQFSERELIILQYFCLGLNACEIAEKICRSIKTIEACRSKLFQKTDTKNTINLVLFAIKNKLVEI
ncbi:MAG: response regulator transcription factor [Mariniphaga sp.]